MAGEGGCVQIGIPRAVCNVACELANSVSNTRVDVLAGGQAQLVCSVDEEARCSSRDGAGALAVLVAGVGGVRDLREREWTSGEALWVGPGCVVGEEASGAGRSAALLVNLDVLRGCWAGCHTLGEGRVGVDQLRS